MIKGHATMSEQVVSDSKSSAVILSPSPGSSSSAILNINVCNFII